MGRTIAQGMLFKTVYVSYPSSAKNLCGLRTETWMQFYKYQFGTHAELKVWHCKRQ